MARKNNERSGCALLVVATVVCLVLGLWGCDAIERFLGVSDSDSTPPPQATEQEGTEQQGQSPQEGKPAQPAEPEPPKESTEDDGQTSQSAQSPSPVIEEPAGYAYSKLSSADREKYRALLNVFLTREEMSYPSTDVDDIGFIRNCVTDDNPELFYVENVQYVTTEDRATGKITSVKVSGVFSYTASETEALQRQVEAEVSRILAGAPTRGDDYAKAKYFYEYLANNARYDHDAQQANLDTGVYAYGQTVVDTLVNHASVCAGYARSLQLLFHRVGIPCALVRGPAHGEAHVWCAAYLDGNWYYIDPTWGDSQIYDEYGQPTGNERMDYDYLCVTGSDLAPTHTPDCGYPMPSCTATADNYYVREGLMLSTADVDAAGAIISAAAARGDGSARFRCANRDVFDQLSYALFDENGVFRFYSGDMFYYYSNEDMYTYEIVFG